MEESSDMMELREQLARTEAQRDRAWGNLSHYMSIYHDLVLPVTKTHIHETRHETARRYIINAEKEIDSPAKSS